jgi:integrase/recombinase XerD
MKLLLLFASERTSTAPAQLDIAALNADTISAFLDHLERDRKNSVRTRNARLTAIRSLLRYAAPRHPEHAATIAHALAIPAKRFERAAIDYLDDPEIDALIAAPDTTTWTGRRDHALITLAIQTGLRASELTSLRRHDAILDTPAHITCHGKGRKQRITPLTRTTSKVLRAHLRHQGDQPSTPMFTTRRGTPLTRDALERRLAIHAATAATACPSLANKHVTAHVLRHTAAMKLLHAGIDIATIALWLGHERIETTGVYLHADLTIKQRALARLTPNDTQTRRYQPTDSTLAYLESL